MLDKTRKEPQAVEQHALFVCLPTFYNASTAPHQIMPNAADSAKHLRCRFLAKGPTARLTHQPQLVQIQEAIHRSS